jgi:hypothetical protein
MAVRAEDVEGEVFRFNGSLTTNYLELGQTGRDLDLNVDRPRLDAFERNGGNPLDHGKPAGGRVAEARQKPDNSPR